MSFFLSARSKEKLIKVEDGLAACVKEAINITKVDFGVIEGLRTPERQLELYEKGASQIKEGGKHVLGLAVDLVAYIGPRASWELNLYDDIADAMKASALALGISLRWGAAWHRNLTDFEGTSEELMNEYIDLRRSEGRRPFIDAPHFELN